MVHKAAAHADQCLQQSVGKPLIDLRCRNNIRSRVYVTVGLPSVRLSVSPIDTAAGGFAAERHAGIRVSVDSCWRRSAGAQQLMRVASCWEPTEEAQRRLVTGRINITDLTTLECISSTEVSRYQRWGTFGHSWKQPADGCVWLLYDTRSYFNVRLKADISQLNLPHGTKD